MNTQLEMEVVYNNTKNRPVSVPLSPFRFEFSFVYFDIPNDVDNAFTESIMLWLLCVLV